VKNGTKVVEGFSGAMARIQNALYRRIQRGLRPGNDHSNDDIELIYLEDGRQGGQKLIGFTG